MNTTITATTATAPAAYAYSDEWQVPGRRVYRTYEGASAAGERIVAEFSVFEDYGGPASVMGRWVKSGHMPARLSTWWGVQVYAYDDAGNCRGRYNPTEKRGGRGYVVDFAWVLEATPENMGRISDEIARRAGISA